MINNTLQRSSSDVVGRARLQPCRTAPLVVLPCFVIPTGATRCSRSEHRAAQRRDLDTISTLPTNEGSYQ